MKPYYKFLSKTLIFALSLALLWSCKKEDDDDQSTQPGNLKVQFEYVFGSSQTPWTIGQTLRHPRSGDTLTFSEFSFYVSNVKLQKADGSYWTEEESYHLICAKCQDASQFTLKDIPAGDYVGLEFLLGVDSLRNVSGAQSGALSPSFGMFWDWNTGYIMIKAEGSSPQSADGGFTFHLGGFSGPNSVLTPRIFPFFGNSIAVNAEESPELLLWANPARLWHSAPSVSQVSTIMKPGPEASNMATNFFTNIALMEVNQ